MFRPNDRHLQMPIISSISQLPEAYRERLDRSWAGTFYREFFVRLDEAPFAVLYADKASRPNVPVNQLVSLEFMKAGHGWSDAEMYDALCFDLQVRYSLGLWDLAVDDFELRTVYNFRKRLTQHMQRTGENLLDQAFEDVTDAQIAAFGLRTDKQRMDSTLVASNIRELSRLQLLVEVLQRVHRMLQPAEQGLYAAAFAPYLKGSAGQYVYHVKAGGTAPHLQAIGELMQQLVAELAPGYAKEATCRTKAGETHKGYVANVTETCHPENPLQLIVKVQTAANITDDGDLFAEAVPALAAHGVRHIQTAIRGAQPSGARVPLAKFGIAPADSGTPDTLTCPQGQTAPVSAGRKHLKATFDIKRCRDCPLFGTRCPVDPGKHRQHAIEATVRSVKHPFPGGKLPVRGRIRMSMLLIGSCTITNVRRIHRYLSAEKRPNNAQRTVNSRPHPEQILISGIRYTFATPVQRLQHWLHGFACPIPSRLPRTSAP